MGAAVACQLPTVSPGSVACVQGGPACPDGLTCVTQGDGGVFCDAPGSTVGSTTSTSTGASTSTGSTGVSASTGTTTASAATTSGGATSAAATSGSSTAGATGATSAGSSTSGTVCGAPVCVETLAGGASAGNVDGTGGPTGSARFNNPVGLAFDPTTANLFVADFQNNAIRIVAPGGATTTLAGDGTAGFVDGTGGPSGSTRFNGPKGVFAFGGQVYIGDWMNNRVRVALESGIDSGQTRTLTGNGTAAWADGTGGPSGTAELDAPYGIVLNSQGTAYLCDEYNNRIRIILTDGGTLTLAGNGSAGWLDDAGSAAQFAQPRGLAIDAEGNLYVADWKNNRIRMVTPDGTTSTLAGNGTPGFVDGTVGPQGEAEFNGPDGVALDQSGNLYIADSLNNRVRKFALDGGTVSTLAGAGDAGFKDGPGPSAEFSDPAGIAVDGQGNVYVSDRGNSRIRVISQ